MSDLTQNALSRRAFIAFGAATSALVSAGAAGAALAPAAGAAPRTMTAPVINPIVRQRADPWLMKHTDGRYYFTGSVPAYDRIIIRSASAIAELDSAAETSVWIRPASGLLGGHIWAPELHYFDNQWHIYFAAGNSNNFFDVRVYVISNAAADPTVPTWTEPKRVHTHEDSFSLDATTFEHRGQRYLVWAQTDPGVNSSLFIAPMSSPSELAAPSVRICVPTYDWETRVYKVAEGAAVIKRNGRIFMTYSASATDANYCMGLLTASEDADLLDPASWVKSPEPVLATSELTRQYGPGHNSFSVDAKGNDVLVYHARSYRQIIGDPLYDPNRHARVQRLYWKADGSPEFGVPVGDGELPVRLRSGNLYLTHDGRRIQASADASIPSSQFRLSPGYARKNSTVIEPVLAKGHYLRLEGSEVVISATAGASSAFEVRGGLADSGGVSFEAVDYKGHFLCITNVGLQLRKVGRDERGAATFYLED